MSNVDYIKTFDEINLNDLALVGGKNASLGEMYQALRPRGIRIPEGFVLTANAFARLFENQILSSFVYDRLETLDPTNVSELEKVGREIRNFIQQSQLPPDISTSIRNAYTQLCQLTGTADVDVAVRSSATAEDLPDASFAGQQESYLNVRGSESVIAATLNCMASLFTDRAISYRFSHGFDHRKVRISVGVQQMVRSDCATSGVTFTLDTESGARNVILINSSYGLGENIVKGKVDPDEFLVSKSTIETARVPILRKKLGSKKIRMVYANEETNAIKNVEVSSQDQNKYSLTDQEVVTLAKWSLLIEDYYSKIRKKETPMDIEWAKDGITGELYILQARPETVHSLKKPYEAEVMKLESRSEIILRGKAVGSKIGHGPAKIVNDIRGLKDFNQGDVLVADMTDPDWEPVMKKAAAIITNRGGRTCHAAIVSREHGVPCIVGTGTATSIIRTGQDVTVSCAEGEIGVVMKGKLPFTTETLNWENFPRTRTKIMVNAGNPDQALKASMLPVDGVGLARMEFIITDQAKIHPMALLHPERVHDPIEKEEINVLIRGHENDPGEFFIQRLSEGIGMIAGAFFPLPVIVRLSDFKSNEYAHLLGGESFEQREENPMIGLRGASRYYSPLYREAFALECRALRFVREEMGLKNIKIMVPFCRTAKEGRLVIEEMQKHQLIQGEDGLEIYVMCELPSNVMDLSAFAEIFDGFSIGSNDLTQMTLGADRDSELIGKLFDERDPAVLKMIGLAIDGAKRAGRTVGICGQAPSDFPEFASFLVDRGIDSISLSPDSVMKTLPVIRDAESKEKNERWYR